MPMPPTFRLLAAVCGVLFAAACSSTPDRPPSTLERAESAYRRGDYETASTLALSLERNSHGPAAREAAYVHGLAAARLGRSAEARRALESAAASGDPDLASRARRSLAALDGSPDADVGEAGGLAPRGGGFTVQAGAYSRETAARSRAAELDALARGAGYGPASVRRISSHRGTLWAVQIGRFGDRRQAGAARDRLGHPEWAVEALDGR